MRLHKPVHILSRSQCFFCCAVRTRTRTCLGHVCVPHKILGNQRNSSEFQGIHQECVFAAKCEGFCTLANATWGSRVPAPDSTLMPLARKAESRPLGQGCLQNAMHLALKAQNHRKMQWILSPGPECSAHAHTHACGTRVRVPQLLGNPRNSSEF